LRRGRERNERNEHNERNERNARRPANMLSSQRLRPACQLLTRRCVPARAFHASAPRRNPVLNTILYLPHEMMTLIHAQVPWYAALPIAAFITRGLLVTTAGAWARSLTARYIGLQPLRQALAVQKRDNMSRQGNFRSPKEAIVAIRKEIKNEVAKLDKRWNVTIRGQISWTFAQIPIFFTMAEVIRQMCGARDGLLAMGTSYFNSGDKTAAADQLAGPVDAVTADSLAVAASNPWFEPSLANEGMLWFQDLLLPDPTGVLPFVVSGLMFSNIYFTKNTVNNDKNWPNLLRRTLLGVSLLVGPICQSMPAALMLYWASSTSSVMLWNAWLDWRYPAPRGFTACKLPLQMPPAAAPKGRKL
jgi:inner membrane protein COX18